MDQKALKQKCAVCLRKLYPSDIIMKPVPVLDTENCRHFYHPACISNVLKLQRAVELDNETGEFITLDGMSPCPVCRTVFDSITFDDGPYELHSGPETDNDDDDISSVVPVTTPSPSSSMSTPSTTGEIPVDGTPRSSSSPSTPSGRPRNPAVGNPRGRRRRRARVLWRAVSDQLPTNSGIAPEKRDVTCPICLTEKKNKQGKSRCIQKHRGPYSCPSCDRPFSYPESMRRHCELIHGMIWTRRRTLAS